MFEIVEGIEVPVRFFEGGRYVKVDDLSAFEQAARNQYQRRLRERRRLFLQHLELQTNGCCKDGGDKVD